MITVIYYSFTFCECLSEFGIFQSILAVENFFYTIEEMENDLKKYQHVNVNCFF